MNILETIAADAREAANSRAAQTPYAILEKSALFTRETISLSDALADPGASGIIAEFKRKSPSKGIINDIKDPAPVVSGYAKAGASAISVLTEQKWFGGSADDFTAVRSHVSLPLLRKDFITSEYHVIESKSIGADIILLIAALMTPAEIRTLASLARSLGLQTLLEIHSAEELDHITEQIDYVGVNNRNLKDFTVDTGLSARLAASLPRDRIWITESGLNKPEEVHSLREAGFSGFLMGERFMRHPQPTEELENFISELALLKKTAK
ncbi:MAG: indole-3-glycerol phosphate synthase TrpC [Bacteroidales bacterium]|nr:indole-3-glycerol phosphate synthase TrpC [Bacteroidales bacterium]